MPQYDVSAEASFGRLISDADVASFVANGFVIKRNFYTLEEIEVINAVKAADFQYNLEHGPWQDRQGVPREIWDSIPNDQHNLPTGEDGLGHTLWNAISYGARMNGAMKRLLVEGPRDHAGAPPCKCVFYTVEDLKAICGQVTSCRCSTHACTATQFLG